MERLDLRTKLIIGFVFPILMLFIVSLIGVITGTLIGRGFIELTTVDVPLLTALDEMKLTASRLISSTNELLLDNLIEGNENESGSSSELNQIQVERERFNTAFGVYTSLIPQADIGEDLPPLNREIEAFLNQVDTIVELAQSASVEAIAEARDQFEEIEIEFLQSVDTAILVEEAELARSQENVGFGVNAATWLIVGVGVVTSVISVGFAFYLIGSTNQKLNKLKTMAESLRAGKMDQRVEISSQDELGQFAQTFNEMAARVEGLVSALQQEVSNAEAARAKAEHSDQVKSAFLASMSHELRTPLNAIINFTKFVANGDLGDINDEQKETLHDVVDSAKHLLNLINDVLDMAKIESGSLTLFVTENVDLQGLINQVASTARGLIHDKPVDIQMEVTENLPRIRGDRQRLLQILLNIMSNACKFTQKGSITIKAHAVDRDVVIQVTDTGPGIAPEDHDAVFQAFKQTISGLRQAGGTGLGMPITKNLVEAHGGKLQLESALGEGTTFTVILPVTSDILVPTLA